MPATTNPLGVKGVGEAGTTAAIAAVMNAIADAVPGAADQMEMPATPAKMWRACQEAGAYARFAASSRRPCTWPSLTATLCAERDDARAADTALPAVTSNPRRK